MTVNVSKQTAYVAMLSPQVSVSKQTAYFVMLPATETVTTTISARIELAATLDTSNVVENLYLNISARIELGAVLGDFRVTPAFVCRAPAVKEWSRPTITAKAWTCAVVTPATSCDDEVVTPENADVLAYVDGDIFVTVQGYQLKLIG